MLRLWSLREPWSGCRAELSFTRRRAWKRLVVPEARMIVKFLSACGEPHHYDTVTWNSWATSRCLLIITAVDRPEEAKIISVVRTLLYIVIGLLEPPPLLDIWIYCLRPDSREIPMTSMFNLPPPLYIYFILQITEILLGCRTRDDEISRYIRRR